MPATHLKLCLFFILLIIPVAIADYNLLKGSGGGWISLNLRGLFIGAYVLFLVVHLPLSSVIVKSIPTLNLALAHLASAAAAIVIIAIGVKIYSEVDRAQSRKRWEAEVASRRLLLDVIHLNSWRFLSNPDDATEIEIDVTTRESGRFAVNINGFNEPDEVSRDWFFQGIDSIQVQTEKGQRFTHRVPLKRDSTGVPKMIEITLYLFADDTGSAGTNVIKIFKPHPETEDDGSYFYADLPPPTDSKIK